MSESKFDALLGRIRESDIQNVTPPSSGSTSQPSSTPTAAPLETKDDGASLTLTTASLDFVGAGVTATAVGNDVTVTIPGGGATGDSFQNEENTGTYVYVGYSNTNGSWYIYRRTIATQTRLYATGASGYAAAWTARAGQTYA